jgi:hypothetical protein
MSSPGITIYPIQDHSTTVLDSLQDLVNDHGAIVAVDGPLLMAWATSNIFTIFEVEQYRPRSDAWGAGVVKDLQTRYVRTETYQSTVEYTLAQAAHYARMILASKMDD